MLEFMVMAQIREFCESRNDCKQSTVVSMIVACSVWGNWTKEYVLWCTWGAEGSQRHQNIFVISLLQNTSSQVSYGSICTHTLRW